MIHSLPGSISTRYYVPSLLPLKCNQTRKNKAKCWETKEKYGYWKFQSHVRFMNRKTSTKN